MCPSQETVNERQEGRTLQDSGGESNETTCCSPVEHSLDQSSRATDLTILETLGNGTRYDALRLVSESEGGCCVCELEPTLGVSQSAVSQALAKLREAGLVTRRKEGKWRYYSATPAARTVLDALDQMRTQTNE